MLSIAFGRLSVSLMIREYALDAKERMAVRQWSCKAVCVVGVRIGIGSTLAARRIVVRRFRGHERSARPLSV